MPAGPGLSLHPRCLARTGRQVRQAQRGPCCAMRGQQHALRNTAGVCAGGTAAYVTRAQRGGATAGGMTGGGGGALQGSRVQGSGAHFSRQGSSPLCTRSCALPAMSSVMSMVQPGCMHAPRNCTTCTLRHSFRIAICARSPHTPGQGSPQASAAPRLFQSSLLGGSDIALDSHRTIYIKLRGLHARAQELHHVHVAALLQDRDLRAQPTHPGSGEPTGQRGATSVSELPPWWVCSSL